VKDVDGRFEYRDDRFPFGSDCACRLRVWLLTDDRNVVMATQLEPSPGASVTNSCERWAAEACREYLLDPLKTVFIENYDRRESEKDVSFPPESFDFITFTWSDARTYKELDQALHASKPQWKHGTRGEVEALIGEKLP
jgi:hypothetical protein